MAYSAIAVANAFIDKASKGQIPALTPMKLQKMMFYAQSWHLRLYDEPLIDDFFSKWKYGPVIPSLYHELKNYGAKKIDTLISSLISDFVNNDELWIATPILPDTDKRTCALIKKIIDVYGPLRGTQLSWLTHLPGTAWSETKSMGDVITNELMKEKIK